MREKLSRWTQASSNWLLAALLFALPSGRHWVLLQARADQAHDAYYEPVLYVTDLLLLAVLCTWLAARLLDHERNKLRWGPAFLYLPLLGLLALGLISLPRAIDPIYALFPLARLALMLVFYFLLVNAPLQRGLIVWPLVASMVIQATVSVPQFLLGHTAGLEQLGEMPNDSRWPGASVVAMGERRWLRAAGLTQHPNILGGLAMAALLIGSGYCLRRSGLRRLVLLGVLSVTVGTLLITFSRAAWLGTTVGSLVLLGLLIWAQRIGTQPIRRSSLWLLAGVVLAVVLVFVSLVWPLLMGRLGLASEGIEIRSVEERALLSQAGLDLIELRPWLGVGLGSFSSALYHLTPEAVATYASFAPVHNVLILATAELGLGGGLLWLCLIASPWLALWLRRRRVEMTPWWAGLCGAIAAFTVASFFDHYIWTFQQGRLMLWLVWGLWAREWTSSLASH
ncbi:MAG: O-antigen ligase family protein [Anaerolineae bacterium]|jgi:hypothetical protein